MADDCFTYMVCRGLADSRAPLGVDGWEEADCNVLLDKAGMCEAVWSLNRPISHLRIASNNVQSTSSLAPQPRLQLERDDAIANAS